METNRPAVTHVVLSGRLKFNAYRDGDVLRAIDDDHVVARMKGKDGWNRPVALAKQPKAAGRWDHIKPLGPAVVVTLTKGLYY